MGHLMTIHGAGSKPEVGRKWNARDLQAQGRDINCVTSHIDVSNIRFHEIINKQVFSQCSLYNGTFFIFQLEFQSDCLPSCRMCCDPIAGYCSDREIHVCP